MLIAVETDEESCPEIEQALFDIGFAWRGYSPTHRIPFIKDTACLNISNGEYEKQGTPLKISRGPRKFYEERGFKIVPAERFFSDVLPNLKAELAVRDEKR